MTGVPAIVLDACVLANFSLCDTLLRLAEPPRLYEPKWSDEILAETIRTLESKLGWPARLTAHLKQELLAHFSDALVSGYEALIPELRNDEKDRHVLAAAIQGQAPFIVTFNLRHFRREHLKSTGVAAMHPDDFLVGLFQQEPQLILSKVQQQAADRNRALDKLLGILSKTVPRFTQLIAGADNS